MLHHAEMDAAEMAALGDLLDLLHAHPGARCRPMATILAATHQEACA
jgi:hypothetical protein